MIDVEQRRRPSARQKEIMEYLCLGCTNQEISQFLGVSVNTIKTHVTSLYKLLDVTNRTEAVHRYNELFEKTYRGRTPSVTLLPFAAMGSEARERDAAELTELVLCYLSRWNRFSVQSHSLPAVHDTKHNGFASLPLDATYAIYGGLIENDMQLQVWVRLLELSRRKVHCVQVFDVISEVPNWVRNLSSHIVAVAMCELLKAEYTRTEGQAIEQLSATERTLRGIQLLSVRTRAHCERALELFQSALADEPELAMAHFGVAYASFLNFVEQRDPDSAIEKVHFHALRCAQLDQFSHDGSQILSTSRLLQGRLDDAISLLRVAVSVNPSSALGFNLLAQFHSLKGNLRQGLLYANESARLSEYTPEYSCNQGAAALIHFAMGDYGAAAEACRKTLRYDFESRLIMALLVAACFLDGKREEAERARHQLLHLTPRFRIEELQLLLQHVPPVARDQFLNTMRDVGLGSNGAKETPASCIRLRCQTHENVCIHPFG